MNRHTFRLAGLFCSAAIGLALFAMPAFAAGGEASDGNIFTGDAGSILWTLVVFLGVVFVLGRFAWGPILEGLQKREDFIREALEEARRDRDATAATLKTYEDKLAEARAEATQLVEEGRRDAEVVKARIEEEAKAESEKIIERAKREIGIARVTAVKELYEASGEMAAVIAGRIIGREINASDHERLIASAIEEIRSSGDSSTAN